MPDPIRKDIFASDRQRSYFGYAVLRKERNAVQDSYLPEITVSPKRVSEGDIESNKQHVISDSELYESIEDGDIAFITKKGSIRVVLSKNANHNTLLVTERCDNSCSFCSQPPKEVQDDWLLIQSAMALAAFKSKDVVGISGGEPLLYRETFVRFLNFVKQHCPETPLHILTNGRSFSDKNFTQSIAESCNGLDVTFGIPLYSVNQKTHDSLVGSIGAHKETIIGLINAGNSGIPIELRFIPTKENPFDAESVVNFVSRCLSNIAQVSIMNLEPAGWARRNWKKLYLRPETYQHSLTNAVSLANRSGLPIRLFNYPLCHLPRELWENSVKSISDWKNYYQTECESCSVQSKCTGFFTSSTGIFNDKARPIL